MKLRVYLKLNLFQKNQIESWECYSKNPILTLGTSARAGLSRN
jgi:hypothetical protein